MEPTSVAETSAQIRALEASLAQLPPTDVFNPSRDAISQQIAMMKRRQHHEK
jgi:hypothetical protein